MSENINLALFAKCHKWAAELSKHSPEELMDVNSAISDDARKEGVIYMFGIDDDNEHVVSAGARRAHGSEQLNSFFFFEPEKSFKKFGTDGVSVCATEVCCFAALRDYFAATPYTNVDAVWIEQDDGTHLWLFDGDMFPYSDFVVNDENGNRIGIGRVFSVESFEKELFAFRPSPMLTAISQEDGKSVVPVSALYWTQHANFVTRGVEGIIVNRMRERMEDDNELTIAGNGSGSIAANPDSSYMFSSTEYGYYFGSVKEILGLELLDTTNVTTMCGMFYECTLLDGLDVSSFNTSNVTDISSMFSCCKSLSSLDVLIFDTSKVTNMSWLFGECWALESLDLTGWDTSKVTNMYAMFKNCYSLPEIDVTGFDTSNVTTMYIMFRGCHSLTTLDLTSFETSKVINMGGMFQECYKLTTIYVTTGLWDMTNVKYSSSMYKDSTKLKGDKGGKLTYMTV